MTTAKEDAFIVLVFIIIFGLIMSAITGARIHRLHEFNKELQFLVYKRNISAMQTVQEIKQYCNKKEMLP
jgi:hypothetical protein